MPKRLLKASGVVWDQVKQIYSGVRKLFSWSFVGDIVPDWLLRITVEAVPNALAGDEPEDQIEGAVVMVGWSIFTSLFTGFTTAVIAFFWAIFLLIGILRFSDVGSGAWDRATSTLAPSLPGRGSDGSYGRRRGK